MIGWMVAALLWVLGTATFKWGCDVAESPPPYRVLYWFWPFWMFWALWKARK